ncbi:hypothetical protein M9H77_22415 [Catharanthus roseus]|uniref:Uncharacterized protein n=1 Tax=Catharanthus roseus TaxID=4058 RepID=A0ACC0ASY9_CATRO|nr:hypothetical protein M9H77_22415 [Catharanthus roseus]
MAATSCPPPYLRLQFKDLSTRSAPSRASGLSVYKYIWKPHSDQGYGSGYDHVFENVRGLHCTWLVPYTRASSNDVDDFRLGSVDPLEEGRSTVEGVEAALMCLDSLRLPSCARNPHAGLGISVVQLTQDSQRHSKQLKF